MANPSFAPEITPTHQAGDSAQPRLPTFATHLLRRRGRLARQRGRRSVSSVVFQEPVVDRGLSGRANLELHAHLWGGASGRLRAARGFPRDAIAPHGSGPSPA